MQIYGAAPPEPRSRGEQVVYSQSCAQVSTSDKSARFSWISFAFDGDLREGSTASVFETGAGNVRGYSGVAPGAQCAESLDGIGI